MVEESTWDHHANIQAFLKEQDAIDFCNHNFKKVMSDPDSWVAKNGGYDYWVEAYELA